MEHFILKHRIMPLIKRLPIIIFATLYSCTSYDSYEVIDGKTEVKVEINNPDFTQAKSRNVGSSIHSVDRILLLPFKKTNEALENIDTNFEPEYTAAKQVDVNSFPVSTMTMALTSSSTYKIIVLGFNRTDYNMSDPNNTNNTFSLGSTDAPVTLANFHLQAAKATVVPEFFTDVCICYNNGEVVGEFFKPATLQDISLEGNLERIVSGLNVELSDIPEAVTSVSLIAEQLVKAVQPTNATPTLWQTSDDGEERTIAIKAPSLGTVSFGNLLLPTTDIHSTKLYLDLTYYGTLTERYIINVPDVAGVSSSNSITFTKNQVVNISGSYNSTGLDFKLNATINLEDDIWDGIIL